MRKYMEDLRGGWQRSAGLPLTFLLVALATLFLFGNDRGHFYRPGHHDWLSSKTLALAESLSAEHRFTLFHRLHPNQDGNAKLDFLYNRFPIGGYALIKLAILPFDDDLSAKIHAGRMLMLAFFAAAAVLAHLALGRITGSRWTACAATALAFSAYFHLYYSDMITTEVSVDLFGVMLAFHGMTVFVQEGRFRQLLIKTCIALLLGWHVYALLLPFIAFSLASEMIQAHRAAPNSPLRKIKHFSTAFLLGRPFALGVAALAFGLLILSFNIASEYFALNGTTAVTELPTFQSVLKRAGQDQEFQTLWDHHLSWPIFLETQFQILGSMIFPYSLPGYAGALQLVEHPNAPVTFQDMFIFGIAALAACMVGLYFTQQKILLATLMLSGFFWTFPMRYSTAFHDYEGMFYVGVPLTLFSFVLLYVRRLSGERLMARIAVVALLFFVYSNYQMSFVGHNADRENFQAEVVSDFQAIRGLTSGGSIGVAAQGAPEQVFGATYALDYYLSSRIFLVVQHLSEFALEPERLKALDFIVTDWRKSGVATLTPKNRRFFLYDRAAYVGEYDTMLGNLLVQSNFDVYHRGNALIYFKSPCTEADTQAQFLLHVSPRDLADLPEDRRRHRFDNLDFSFIRYGEHFETRAATLCTAQVGLPSYGIAQISTGQFNEQGPLWWEDFSLPR